MKDLGRFFSAVANRKFCAGHKKHKNDIYAICNKQGDYVPIHQISTERRVEI